MYRFVVFMMIGLSGAIFSNMLTIESITSFSPDGQAVNSYGFLNIDADVMIGHSLEGSIKMDRSTVELAELYSRHSMVIPLTTVLFGRHRDTYDYNIQEFNGIQSILARTSYQGGIQTAHFPKLNNTILGYQDAADRVYKAGMTTITTLDDFTNIFVSLSQGYNVYFEEEASNNDPWGHVRWGLGFSFNMMDQFLFMTRYESENRTTTASPDADPYNKTQCFMGYDFGTTRISAEYSKIHNHLYARESVDIFRFFAGTSFYDKWGVFLSYQDMFKDRYKTLGTHSDSQVTSTMWGIGYHLGGLTQLVMTYVLEKEDDLELKTRLAYYVVTGF